MLFRLRSLSVDPKIIGMQSLHRDPIRSIRLSKNFDPGVGGFAARTKDRRFHPMINRLWAGFFSCQDFVFLLIEDSFKKLIYY